MAIYSSFYSALGTRIAHRRPSRRQRRLERPLVVVSINQLVTVGILPCFLGSQCPIVISRDALIALTMSLHLLFHPALARNVMAGRGQALRIRQREMCLLNEMIVIKLPLLVFAFALF